MATKNKPRQPCRGRPTTRDALPRASAPQSQRQPRQGLSSAWLAPAVSGRLCSFRGLAQPVSPGWSG